MGGLFMRDRRITGITGLGIVRRLLGIGQMDRISRDIDRRRIMVEVVRRIRGMVEGRLEMGEERVLRAMEGELLVMAVGPGHLGMVVELVRLETVVGLGLLGIREAAGRPLRHVLPRHRGQHRRLVLLQPLLIGQLLDRCREDLILVIRRVVRSRRNGLSRRQVRGRVGLVEITMARRRDRRVIAAKPVLVAVGVREVNRDEAFQT
jgi:hypothetical protein